MKSISNKSIFLIVSAILIAGCSTVDNFTTFFNTYYNADRLITESETEFEYQDEKKRIMPKVFISQPNYWVNPDPRKSPVVFMDEFVIDNRKLQPVKIKLDSVIIKGSKILAKHPNSVYVEKTLYLMAKSFFYQSDWVNCQVKCSELIDKFPNGELMPDAHLMIAKTYLVRKQTLTGLTILSRTVDVAWLQKRYDILSEAFRLEAEVALRDSRFDDALKPYLQAIVQCDDDKQKAKWQVDLAALLYRIGRYDKAAIAFKQVENYSPDYAGMFESRFYNAMCQIRLGNNQDGMAILYKLENDKKFEEWKEYVVAGKLLNYTLTQEKDLYLETEKFADSAYSNSHIIQAIYFEKAMMLFKDKNYFDARRYLAQVRNARSDFYTTANRVYQNLQLYSQKQSAAMPGIKKFNSDPASLNDSVRTDLSKDTYEYARINEILGNADTAKLYYKYAMDIAPRDSSCRAQFLYTYQRVIRDENPLLADSLYEQIADLYPKTEYGKEAYKKLGYTEFYAIDTLPELYKSANQMRRNGLYNQAIDSYSKIYNKYDTSNFAPKSIYSIGLVYENNLKNMDSAAFYYNLLLTKYPDSELANEVRTSVVFKQIKSSGMPIPDSLQAKKVFISPKRNYLAEIEAGNEIERTTHFDRQQSIKKEKSTLENLWDNVKDNFNPMKNIDSLKPQIKGAASMPDIKFNNPLDQFKEKEGDKNNIPVEPKTLDSEIKPVVIPTQEKKENGKETKK